MSAMFEHDEPDPADPWDVLVGSGGRIVIPAGARELLGIKPGDTVRMRLDGGNLVISTPAATIAWLRGIVRGLGAMQADPVAELEDERRREARRELENG